MGKYKIGDEVLVRAKIIAGSRRTFGVDIEENRFDVCEENIVAVPDMTVEEAWELAKKILLYPDHELEEIFGRTEPLLELTPQEAKAKIEAWEAEKEIKVGDVVTVSSYEGIVTRYVDVDGFYALLFLDGDVGYYQRSSLKKTGRHIDIKGILNQIGGDE